MKRIEEIYNMVYEKSVTEKPHFHDRSDRVTELAEPLENEMTPDQYDKVLNIICQTEIYVEQEGFIQGFTFAIELMCECFS